MVNHNEQSIYGVDSVLFPLDVQQNAINRALKLIQAESTKNNPQLVHLLKIASQVEADLVRQLITHQPALPQDISKTITEVLSHLSLRHPDFGSALTALHQDQTVQAQLTGVLSTHIPLPRTPKKLTKTDVQNQHYALVRDVKEKIELYRTVLSLWSQVQVASATMLAPRDGSVYTPQQSEILQRVNRESSSMVARYQSNSNVVPFRADSKSQAVLAQEGERIRKTLLSCQSILKLLSYPKYHIQPTEFLPLKTLIRRVIEVYGQLHNFVTEVRVNNHHQPSQLSQLPEHSYEIVLPHIEAIEVRGVELGGRVYLTKSFGDKYVLSPSQPVLIFNQANSDVVRNSMNIPVLLSPSDLYYRTQQGLERIPVYTIRRMVTNVPRSRLQQ